MTNVSNCSSKFYDLRFIAKSGNGDVKLISVAVEAASRGDPRNCGLYTRRFDSRSVDDQELKRPRTGKRSAILVRQDDRRNSGLTTFRRNFATRGRAAAHAKDHLPIMNWRA